jgi:hypothetical protein
MAYLSFARIPKVLVAADGAGGVPSPGFACGHVEALVGRALAE